MSEHAGRLTVAQVATYPRPGLAMPMRWGFRPDGGGVNYLFSEEGGLVLSLWEYDIASGARQQIAGPGGLPVAEGAMSREEELRRERLRLRELGVTDYRWARKAKPPVLVLPGAEGVRVRIGSDEVRLLEGTAGALDPRPSPDGRWVAFVRGGELHVIDSRGGPARQLTSGAEEGLTHGLAEFIAQEELDRAEGFWWSPDSRRIAFERADSRHIGRFQIVHDEGVTQDIETHEYPFSGEANARVALGIVDLETGNLGWADLGPDEDIYLARVAWRPDGVLVAQVLARDQRSLRLLAFDSETGRATTLVHEEAEPWINLDNDLRFLPDSSFVRSSERTGFRHLYVHAADGSLVRVLTGGEWVVTAVLGIDEAAGTVYFQGTREGVLERHVYSVSIDGGEVRKLTAEPGWHSAVFARDCSLFVDVYSCATTAPVATLRGADGAVEADLFSNDGLDAARLGLAPPLPLRLPAPDGTELHGAVYAPPDRRPGAKYPVVVSVYGGPHAQRVADEWSLTVDLRAQYLAQHGYVVFKLDNRGSANRGVAFEAHLNRAMGTVEVEDQVAGVRFLESLGYADTSRVGIYGWSYGGYITCLALMRAPETFHVGVAGAPVADWDGYDTGYTERYMGTPADNPDGYREGSALTHAGELQGKLMLVHGLVDENVHFRHTVRLVAALTEAQKEYDLLLFPGERHMPRGRGGLEYMERRLFDYFERHLRAP